MNRKRVGNGLFTPSGSGSVSVAASVAAWNGSGSHFPVSTLAALCVNIPFETCSIQSVDAAADALCE